MLQNSPTKHQKTQHIVRIAGFVLTDLIFHLLFYKCGLPESQALRAGFGQAPPSGMAHHLAGGGGGSSSWLWARTDVCQGEDNPYPTTSAGLGLEQQRSGSRGGWGSLTSAFPKTRCRPKHSLG